MKPTAQTPVVEPVHRFRQRDAGDDSPAHEGRIVFFKLFACRYDELLSGLRYARQKKHRN